jgi:hypothetical protein
VFGVIFGMLDDGVRIRCGIPDRSPARGRGYLAHGDEPPRTVIGQLGGSRAASRRRPRCASATPRARARRELAAVNRDLISAREELDRFSRSLDLLGTTGPASLRQSGQEQALGWTPADDGDGERRLRAP